MPATACTRCPARLASGTARPPARQRRELLAAQAHQKPRRPFLAQRARVLPRRLPFLATLLLAPLMTTASTRARRAAGSRSGPAGSR